MKTRHPDDALDLNILRLHRAALTDRQIARELGQTRQRVTARRDAIIKADCAHDPDAREYWRKTA